MSVLYEPFVTVGFGLAVDGQSLGTFSSCEGLGCEVVIQQHEEGGNNSYVWQLPTRLKYSNVTFSRAVTRETEAVARWFASMTTGVRRTTGHITAVSGDGAVLAQWALRDVIPVRWKGPSFNADSPKVATETIEIAHHGFTEFGTVRSRA